MNINNQLNFRFFTNNVKGLQSSKKRVNMFEHFKYKTDRRGILFLQQTHSSIKQWNVEFKVNYISVMVKPIDVILILHFTIM